MLMFLVPLLESTVYVTWQALNQNPFFTGVRVECCLGYVLENAGSDNSLKKGNIGEGF